jgi:hypothetical protein
VTDGRTYWWAKDAGWWRRARVVQLGQEYGPAGPAILDWLSCEAKAQNDGGRVKSGIPSVAHGSFTDAVTVSHVLSRSVTLGLLDEWQERDGVFVCRISGWQKDQERGRAAARQATARIRETQQPSDTPDEGPDAAVTVRHGESRSVTSGHAESPTGQDRTEEQHPPTPQGGNEGGAENGGPARSRTRRVDPAQLPDDFPDDLLPAIAAVLPVLRRVHGMRGGTEPTRRGVALAVHRFPDRDHAAVAGELEQWATAGNGTRRNVKDWSGTFASFLGRSPACEPRTGGGAAVGDELEQHRRRVAAAQRRREEFERGRDRALSPDGAA